MTVSKLILEKSERTTWHFEWMPCHEKFSKNSWQALSSQNMTWEGVGSTKEEDDTPEWRGFWDGVVLRLGAMRRITKRNRERERETSRKVPNAINIIKIEKRGTYAWKTHEHVTCNNKNIMGSIQSNPTITQDFNKENTHLKCMKHCENAIVMQCMSI